jgi:hypothetical protein
MAGIKGRSGPQSERPWTQALRIAVNEKVGGIPKLRLLADVTVGLALNGDIAAIREVADRLDGRPGQQVAVAGDDDGGPVQIIIKQMVNEEGLPLAHDNAAGLVPR